MSGPRRIGADLDHFAMRLLTDCLNEATQSYWAKRAEVFLKARPRVGDFHGRATREQLRAQWIELTAIADACAARASVSLQQEEIDPDVWEAIAC